jgi:arylsulfatase A
MKGKVMSSIVRSCTILCLVAASAWATMSGSINAAELPAEKPWNFVVLLADDLGWSDLACYGADLHQTPNLDRLANESVRFTDAYAAAPVCSPTRASILTGKAPARLHMTIWREASADPPLKRKLLPPIAVGDLPHEEVTLAEVFHDAGYYTAHVGKWHLGDASFFPETHGFDANIGGSHWGAPTTFFFPYSGTGTFGNEFRYVPHLELGSPDEYLTDRLTSEAIRIVEAVHDRPFFLNMWWHSVHTPIEAPAAMVEPYQQKLRPELNHQNAAYAAMIESLDANVGRLLAKLEELDLADRTVVIFTSDNGGFINRHRGQAVTSNAPLRSGKGSLYEGGVRVPLMIRWPGVTAKGQTCHTPVSTIDFYPTLLEIAGLSGNAAHNALVDGKSLVPILKQPDAKLERDTLYWHYPHYYPTTSPVSAIRQGDWKLLHYYEDDRVELYNLADDLGEQTDQVGEHPQLADQLRKNLDAILQDASAQFPTPNEGR